MEKTEMIRKHFEDEAKEYDGIILKLIPYYTEMIGALVPSIPYDRKTAIRVMDLGCGTGTIAKAVKNAYPNARINCLDLSEKMLQMAESKLSGCSDIKFAAGDFYNFNFSDTYDVIVSSLALHHLVTDDDKKLFYGKIYNALSDGGVFYNADLLLGSSEHLQQVYLGKWKEFMGRSVTQDEVENKWMVNYKQEDSPSVLVKQLKWLEDIGFRGVDVVWKYFNFGVYGGQK